MALLTLLEAVKSPLIKVALLDLVDVGALLTHVLPNQLEEDVASNHTVIFVV
jgi:hypothetical protein